MKILVTGANGFIGKELINQLKKHGCEVNVLVRSGTIVNEQWDKVFYCDLSLEEIPINSFINVDVVYHLANIAHTNLSRDNRKKYCEVNVYGTAKLLRAATLHNVKRFIYFSSANINYFENNLRECSICTDSYVGSKMAAEFIVKEYAKLSKMEFCIIRPELVYGVGVKGGLKTLIERISTRKVIPILPSNSILSMVSLSDLVAFSVKVADEAATVNKVYTLSDGNEYKFKDLVNAIAKHVGVKTKQVPITQSLFFLLSYIGDFINLFKPEYFPLNSGLYKKLNYKPDNSIDVSFGDREWRPENNFYEEASKLIKRN